MGVKQKIWNSKKFPGVIPPDPRPGLEECKSGNPNCDSLLDSIVCGSVKTPWGVKPVECS